MAVRCSGGSCGVRHTLCPSQCVFCDTGIWSSAVGTRQCLILQGKWDGKPVTSFREASQFVPFISSQEVVPSSYTNADRNGNEILKHMWQFMYDGVLPGGRPRLVWVPVSGQCQWGEAGPAHCPWPGVPRPEVHHGWAGAAWAGADSSALHLAWPPPQPIDVQAVCLLCLPSSQPEPSPGTDRCL